MNRWIKIVLKVLSYVFATILGGLIVCFANMIYNWWPLGGVFDFPTLGVYIGSVGTVGALFIIWFTNRKQVNTQIDIQKQNQKTHKQNVGIQLFEVRKNVLSDFQKSVAIMRDNNYSQFTIEVLDMFVNENENQRYNIDFKFSNIGYVFGKKYNDEVIKFVESAREVAKQIELFEEVEHEILWQRDSNTGLTPRTDDEKLDIYRDLRIAISNNEHLNASKSFKKISKKNIITLENYKGKITYDYYEELTNKKTLIIEFEKKYEEIYKSLENELYLNDID